MDKPLQAHNSKDDPERHDVKSRFLIFILLFLFPLFFRGEEKRITKVLISESLILKTFIMY